MNPDFKAAKAALEKRELELQRLMRQMQLDKLNTSTVYRNLENELDNVKKKLILSAEKI